jgi:MraZ protein
MFLGEYKHTVDEKGRMKMPSKFREELGGRFVVTRGHEKCIYIYTLEEWEKENAKIMKLPKSSPAVRQYSRHFFRGADTAEMDVQGRFLIPQQLREYSGISKDVVVVGISDRIEVWDKVKWDEYCEGADDLDCIDEALALKMAELGI